MRFPFKFRKHGLPNDGAAYLVDEVIEQICLFFLVVRVGKHAAQKQIFVDGRGDLCQENGIVLVDIGLGVGIIGVHAVSRLMRQREHVVELSDEIEQHIWMDTVDTGGISTRFLAGSFIDIHPAARKQAVEILAVLCAERGKIVFHKRLGFGIGIADVVSRFHQRYIAVIQMQLIRQTVGKQCPRKAGIIVPCLGFKKIGAHLPRIQRRDRVAHSGKRLVQCAECIGAHATIAALTEFGKFAVGQFDGVAVFIRHRALVKIGTFQHGKSRVHARKCGCCQGQQLFLAF